MRFPPANSRLSCLQVPSRMLESSLKRLCASVKGNVHSEPTGSVQPVLANDVSSSPPAILHLVDAHASPPFWIRVLRRGANRTTAQENRRRNSTPPGRRRPAGSFEFGSGLIPVDLGRIKQREFHLSPISVAESALAPLYRCRVSGQGAVLIIKPSKAGAAIPIRVPRAFALQKQVFGRHRVLQVDPR